MTVIEAGQLRKGLAIIIDGTPHILVEMDFVKPGKGQALYKCKLRNLLTESLFDRTYRSGERFETADVHETDIQFLYADADFLHFMHMETYEQMTLARDGAGNALDFVKEGTDVKALLYEGRVIGIELPNFVVLEVTEAEPGVKGDTASGATKPVTVETGYTINVPLFIQAGNYLRIDTRSGQYVERVKGP
jgi:elongation factor P